MALNYRLKKGVLLQAFGDASKACTNDSPHFTDELAAWYLKNQPGCEIYFEMMPGKPSQVSNIPSRPPRQGGPTTIVPPEKPPTMIVPPEKPPIMAPIPPPPVEEISPDEIITAVTEAPKQRKKRVASKSTK